MGSLPRDGGHLAKGGCVTTILESYARDLFAYKHVFITGGTSGIGLGTALAFRDLGATVTATGGDDEDVERAKADTAHEGILFSVLDVRDGKAIKAVLARFRQLDVVVNAAGVAHRDSEYDPDIFADVVSINLVGMMRICAAAKPKLAACKGAIVNIASMLTYVGGPRVPGYSASQGGVGQLTKSLAAAWAPDGVRVNAVAPGWITTPLTRPLREDQGRSQPILARTPMGRWGTSEEVAGGVVFLASPAAQFVTGTILAIDGGFLAA
jgi:NAD(P)-dependent dehydrogenase (short-subunit alcohol dehydrogenase family)